AGGVLDEGALDGFRRVMDNDLDTAGGVDLLFRQVREGNTALDAGDEASAMRAAATVRQIAGALGLVLDEATSAVPEEIQVLVDERQSARQAKDFARADTIRDELVAAGWTVEDSAAGPVARPM
ncbi:MAG: cysteine--tRNA ligase, partial [Actinomycetia bacterium]|nr:cysteine--tRNA ligase [Actinomycetes bacterium]